MQRPAPVDFCQRHVNKSARLTRNTLGQYSTTAYSFIIVGGGGGGVFGGEDSEECMRGSQQRPPLGPKYYIYIWVVVKIMVPFLGTLNIRCRIIIGTPKGTIILTTIHICMYTHIPCIYILYRSGTAPTQ